MALFDSWTYIIFQDHQSVKDVESFLKAVHAEKLLDQVLQEYSRTEAEGGKSGSVVKHYNFFRYTITHNKKEHKAIVTIEARMTVRYGSEYMTDQEKKVIWAVAPRNVAESYIDIITTELLTGHIEESITKLS